MEIDWLRIHLVLISALFGVVMNSRSCIWQLTNVTRTPIIVDGSIIVFALPACGVGWRKASATTRVRIDGTEKGNADNEIVVNYTIVAAVAKPSIALH